MSLLPFNNRNRSEFKQSPEEADPSEGKGAAADGRSDLWVHGADPAQLCDYM